MILVDSGGQRSRSQ